MKASFQHKNRCTIQYTTVRTPADGLLINVFTTVPATVSTLGCLSLACELKDRRGKLCTDECNNACACEPVSLLVEHLQDPLRLGACALKTAC